MKTKNAGYALLEVIVSIVILTMTLSATVGLLWTTSSASARNRDRLTAMYLAQECLEMSRNIRDSAWRQHVPWHCAFGVAGGFQCANLTDEMNALSENLIKIDGVQTKFSRKWNAKVLSDDPTNPDEILVTCSVSWPLQNGSDEVHLSHVLTDWRKK